MRRSRAVTFLACTAIVSSVIMMPAAPAHAAASSTSPDTWHSFATHSGSRWGSGFPSYRRGWRLLASNCGFWGCNEADHYFSQIGNNRIEWKFPRQLQGKFDLKIYTPPGRNVDYSRVTGKIEFEVFEKRPGSNHFSRIKSATFTQHHKRPYQHTAMSNILLDGEVKIRARRVSGVVGLRPIIHLVHKDVLPAHKALVTSVCIANHDDGWSGLLTTVSYFIPGGWYIRALTGLLIYYTTEQLEAYADKRAECKKYHVFGRYAREVAKMSEQGRIGTRLVIYENELSRSNWCPVRGWGVSKTNTNGQVC